MKFLTHPVLYFNFVRRYTKNILDGNRKNIQEFPDIISELNNSSSVHETWKELRKKFLRINSIKEQSVDNTVINTCLLQIKNKDTAVETVKSYFDFLRSNNYTVNVAVANNLIRLISRENATESDKETILWLYENVFKNFPNMNKILKSRLIFGLCKTDKWEEAKEYVDLDVINQAVFTWIGTCFRNGKPQLGWEYLNKINDEIKYIYRDFVKHYADYCIQNFDTKSLQQQNLIKLLQFCKDNDFIFLKKSAEELVEKLPLFEWNGDFVNMGWKGRCPKCGNTLAKPVLHNEHYKILTDYILNKVLISSDVYKSSNPHELTNFISFINKTVPYDVVIDGLNIFYVNNNKMILPILVQQLKRSNRKILILTRKHLIKTMRSNPIFNNVHKFFVDNLSKDDPYLLYAAIKSGPHSKFISNDLMRSQKCQLQDTHLQKLFKTWQIKHQLRVDSINQQTNEINISFPVKFLNIINMDNDGWHIPYTENDSPPDLYSTMKTWICCRKPK